MMPSARPPTVAPRTAAPRDAAPPVARRSVVPARAAHSLWRSAAWTGAAAAGFAAIIAIAAVAVMWLPASGRSGNAGSALRAGLLTFLASLHGGVTVDGVSAGFVPLGMTLLMAAVLWRAGTGLADAAAELEVTEPGILMRAALLQAVAFAVACAGGAAVATLGTSHVRIVDAAVAGFLLCLVAAGGALCRWSSLGADLVGRFPRLVRASVRGAIAAVAVYLVSAAALTADALLAHHDRVELLSRQVGGGWSGLPVLVLGVLAAPNAAITGMGYLAGPGFSVGVGSAVDVTTGAHGLLPAFPVLGAVPVGPAGWPAWVLVVATPVLAGVAVTAVTGRADTDRSATGRPPVSGFTVAALSALLAGVFGAVLSWQAGGALGHGRLATFGASAWQVGLAMTIAVVLGSAVAIAARMGLGALRGRRTAVAPPTQSGVLRSAISVFREELRESVPGPDAERTSGRDKLAG